MRDILTVLAAYSISVALGHFLVVGGLAFLHGSPGGTHPLAKGVGIVERFIYTSVAVVGLPLEVIGGWLALKGLAEFSSGKQRDNLDAYYSYLFGTGLSLIIGTGLGLLCRQLMIHPIELR